MSDGWTDKRRTWPVVINAQGPSVPSVRIRGYTEDTGALRGWHVCFSSLLGTPQIEQTRWK
jgi:hypothetical protein